MPLAFVLRSDYLRVRSLRTNTITVLMTGLSLTVTAFVMAWSMQGQPVGLIVAEPVAMPMEYLAYVVMILAVLAVTSDIECGTAAVAMSLIVDWRRALLSKFVVSAGLAAAVAVPTLALTMLAAGLADPTGGAVTLEAAPALISNLLAVPLAAIVGVAIGTLLRSSILSVSLLLLWAMAVETVLVFIVDVRYGAFLPFKSFGASRVTMDQLAPLAGLAVFVGYALVAGAVAWVVTMRRSEAT